MILAREHAGLIMLVFQSRCFKFSIRIIPLNLGIHNCTYWNDFLQREALKNFTAVLGPVFQPVRESGSKAFVVIPLYITGYR